MLAKPSSKTDWTIGNPNFGTVTVEPTSGKKITGWTPGEAPPMQYMNWLFYNIGEWIKYLEDITDLIASVAPTELDFEELSGTIDGINTTFSMAHAPVNGDNVAVWVNSVLVPKSKRTIIGQNVVLHVDFVPTDPLTESVSAVYLWATGIIAPAGGALVVFGSTGAAETVTAGGGISPSIDSRQLHFVKSAGGAVAVTANPQVVAGTSIGQELKLVGTSDVNYISLADGNGLLLNGPINIKDAVTISLIWNGTKWFEDSRR